MEQGLALPTNPALCPVDEELRVNGWGESRAGHPDEPPPLNCFPPVGKCPHLVWHPLRAAGWLLRNGVGILALIALWSIIAAIPVVQILALGYLLEVQGRVARTGRLRDAFPMLELAPRLGSIVLGIGFWLLPLMFIAGYAADAALIAPGSQQAENWQTAKTIAMAAIGVHLCLALARGGRFLCFFRPLKNLIHFVRMLQPRQRHYWDAAEQNVKEFIARWQFAHLFSLGLRGLIGAFLWLVIPTALFAAADKPEGSAVIVTLLGGVLLMLVFSWLPFLQARFAAENRFKAFFEWRSVRQLFCSAPLACFFAILGVYVLALPLYLSKIALPPRDALVLLTPLFIVSIYPAKVLTGWAYHRAMVKERPARIGWRLLARSLMLPVLFAYVFLLFFTQFIGAEGKAVLFQHHAFLLPVPF
jgi:hypothetical protein